MVFFSVFRKQDTLILVQSVNLNYFWALSIILLYNIVLLFILIVFSLKKRLKENEKVIRKYISEHPIDIGIWFAIIPVIILGLAYFFTSIVNLDQWASFATYTSLGLSITTVIFVLMTYQIQSKSSTVLQFDSTYFQWMGIFLDAVSKDQKSFEEHILLRL